MKLDPSIVIEKDEEVYPPSEDTYLLLRNIHVEKGESVLELGAGSGLITIHMAREVPVLATDISKHAVRLTKRNVERNGVEVELIMADLFNGIKGKFDVIVFNPPYLPGERGCDPLALAWEGGEDGNEVIVQFLEDASTCLKAGGRIYTVLSSHNEEALKIALELYDVRILEEERFFFENIMALELRERHCSSCSSTK